MKEGGRAVLGTESPREATKERLQVTGKTGGVKNRPVDLALRNFNKRQIMLDSDISSSLGCGVGGDSSFKIHGLEGKMTRKQCGREAVDPGPRRGGGL